MRNMKLSLCLALMITTLMMMLTLSAGSSQDGKIHFQDSSELEEVTQDERPGNGHAYGHRGRGRGHQRKDSLIKFEEGLPELYPIKGPAQPPLVLPSHPGRGVGLQKHQNNAPVTNNNLPQPNPYEGNPFLSKFQQSSSTNKYNPNISQGVTNQLPTSDKPVTTTISNNPRENVGNNLLEEETNREGKSSDTTTDINFNDRGLFDTAPHCQPGQILVNNRCRTAV
ncbi:hypothetical protein FF38_01666 [Lucilia cuprina]|uniref:Uncharacterized protein n=1 Tax=Lucilia cuprina TaxID=7375 RepID=A0A0L0BRN5_LUCCU|nr:hypothetical protein CVS40_4609 [Lucilia cuprina]KNC22686.1 hypothetical protein FF38_01666 [Lucilia cuprina]